MTVENQEESSGSPVASSGASWTFFTNHAHVLVCLARDPKMLLREVAERVGITERAVQRIVSELEVEGFILREREGRRNIYQLELEKPLRHPVEGHCTVSGLVAFVLKQG